MGLLGYIKRMNKKVMMEKVRSIAARTGRSRPAVFYDMVLCGLRYGAGYMDYDLFEMYNMNARQRATILTRNINNNYIRSMNDPAYRHIFENKDEFNARFRDFLGRDTITLDGSNREEAARFWKKHPVFMAKPRSGSCGKGIEKLDAAGRDPAELYDHLMGTGQLVLEEVIRQHERLNELYPCSINTLRVVTMYDDKADKVAVITTFLRIGNGGRVVDNFNSQGMCSPVDERSGIVRFNAMDKAKNLYVTHPMTGTVIKGFQLPCWEQALDTCRRAARVVPQVRYVGWDIAFTPDGPVLVEGNDYPGHDIYQMPEFCPDKIGLLPKVTGAEFI